MDNIVIAGFGSAGYAALMSVKRTNPKIPVLVIDPKPFDLLHPCGLPYSLEGIIDRESLVQDINLHSMNVKKVTGVLKKIDVTGKKALVDSAEGSVEVGYGRIIIATGNTPYIPEISGLKDLIGKNLFTMTGIRELDSILAILDDSGSAAVVGAGAIGLECALALARHKKNVTVIEAKKHVLPGILDDDIAEIVEQYIEQEGIKFIPETSASGFSSNRKSIVINCDGADVTADFGILSVGFRPGTAAATASGLAVGPYGIEVSDTMRTGYEDIFAAGDCAMKISVLDGKPVPSMLATSAYKQGIVAGTNAAGGDMKYCGTASTFVTRLGDLEVAGTGFSSAAATARGFKPVVGKIKSRILPDYFPDNPEIMIKVIVDAGSRKVIGAQAVGVKGAAERINIISGAIEFGLSIDDVTRIEMAYCPAVSEVHDPLHRAVEFCIRRLR